MRKGIITAVFFSALCGSFVSHGEGLRTIQVQTDSIVFSDIMPEVKGDNGMVVIAESPRLGQSKIITSSQIEKRLKEAMISYAMEKLPRKIRIVRPAQVITEPQLQACLQGAVFDYLNKYTKNNYLNLRRLDVRGGMTIPKGAIQCAFDSIDSKLQKQTAYAYVQVAGQNVSSKIPVRLEFDVNEAVRKPLLNRGDRVLISIVTASVVLKSEGIVQQTAKEGDWVTVLPTHGQKIIRARVVDAKNVEVPL